MNSSGKSLKNDNQSYAKVLLKVVIISIVFLLGIHLTLQYLNLEVFYQQNGQVYELSNRFDFDDESSVPTWISSVLFLSIGAFALLAAYIQSERITRRLWLLIAVIGLVLSIDEIAALHEFVLQTLHVLFFQDDKPSILANAWLVVAPFIVIIMAWLAWKMLQIFPRRTVVLFVVAGIIFLTGAVVVDLFTSVADRETFLNQGIYVGIEEFLELMASALSLYAVVDYVERYSPGSFMSALRRR